MDAVIAYVNGEDPQWARSYAAKFGSVPAANRFRDYGTLPYLLRSIAKNMPFIENVHLLVSGDSQIPDWANRDAVRIVRHREFIPKRHLPIFNSSSIEMYLHRIPGLDRRFIYFNDDMFVLKPCQETDFFDGDKPVIWVPSVPVPSEVNIFQSTVLNSCLLACRLSGKRIKPGRMLKPQHAPTPMNADIHRLVESQAGEAMEASISPLRERKNLNQYLFSDYCHLTGFCKRMPLDFSYLDFGKGLDVIKDRIIHPRRALMCINDSGCTGDFKAAAAKVAEALRTLFPNPCKYE